MQWVLHCSVQCNYGSTISLTWVEMGSSFLCPGFLCTLQVLCYIAAGLAEGYEAESVRKQKGKHAKDTLSWEDRSNLMTQFVQLGSLELHELWDPPSVTSMEDLAALFANTCYKFLENPAITREKALLADISSLLGMTVKKYGLVMSKCVFDLSGC